MPSCQQDLSHHFRFDHGELDSCRRSYDDQSLRWMDREFMVQLALDPILRLVRPLLPPSPGGLSSPERIDNG
ncbi:MAG: hypothetical protein WAM11_15540 [Cyanobium sp.]